MARATASTASSSGSVANCSSPSTLRAVADSGRAQAARASVDGAAPRPSRAPARRSGGRARRAGRRARRSSVGTTHVLRPEAVACRARATRRPRRARARGRRACGRSHGRAPRPRGRARRAARVRPSGPSRSYLVAASARADPARAAAAARGPRARRGSRARPADDERQPCRRRRSPSCASRWYSPTETSSVERNDADEPRRVRRRRREDREPGVERGRVGRDDLGAEPLAQDARRRRSCRTPSARRARARLRAGGCRLLEAMLDARAGRCGSLERPILLGMRRAPLAGTRRPRAGCPRRAASVGSQPSRSCALRTSAT